MLACAKKEATATEIQHTRKQATKDSFEPGLGERVNQPPTHASAQPGHA